MTNQQINQRPQEFIEMRNIMKDYAFMLAALVHDLGKAVSTFREGERIHSYGHEEKGAPAIIMGQRWRIIE